MPKIGEFIKRHPIAVSVIVFLVLGYWIYSRAVAGNSGDGATMSAAYLSPDAATIQAATQLQGAQIAAQQRSYEVNAAAGVASQQIAGQVTVAQLQAETKQQADSLSAQTAQAVASLQAQVATTVSTLQASVINAQTAATVAMNASNNATQLGIASLPYELEKLRIQQGSNDNSKQAKYNQAIQKFAATYPTSPIGAQIPGIIADVDAGRYTSFYFG